MCAFIATVRRMPGGSFAKTPKSQHMTAVPVQTSLLNLTSYFNTWPKRKSQFLVYGPRRLMGTAAHGHAGVDVTDVDDVPEHLYGPQLSTPGGGQSKVGGGQSAVRRYGGAPAPPAPAAPSPGAAAQQPLGLVGLMKRFRKGEKLSMVTAYDFPSARLARGANVEIILVGDSLGNCRLGLPDTVGVSMDDMLRATTSARRGIDAPAQQLCASAVGPKPILIGDMPFGSYLIKDEALRNAAALRVAGADMVKLEGGGRLAPTVRALTDAGIAVMGHIGLEPQHALLQGGLRLQGTTAAAALKIVKDAQELVEAGAVALVVECVPVEVGRLVQAAVPSVPVIGIGAGSQVAGQVLVCDDMLGLHGKPPSFAKMYADVAQTTANAYASYVSEVRSSTFPGPAHSRHMKPQELDKLRELLPVVPGLEAALLPEADVVAPVSHSRYSVDVLGTREAAVSVGVSGAVKLPSHEVMFVPKVNGLLAGTRPLLQSRLLCSSVTPSAVEVLRSRKEVRAWRDSERSSGRRMALVPTMGNLHEGHLELVEIAKRHADDVMATIFVNPSQFAAHEDLDKYPRTLERDLELLQKHGVKAVFAPTSSHEMYPAGSPGSTVVVPSFVAGKSEAASRPHHFLGVATVCLKLFNICDPDVVVFGQKDAMQCAVIAQMLQDFFLEDRISLVVAPTSREADGLARSSRNSYLTPAMREKAPAIYKALIQHTQAVGATPASAIAAIRKDLERAGMDVGYVSVADALTMSEKGDGDMLAGSVVSVSCLVTDGDKECRLIDNVIVPQ